MPPKSTTRAEMVTPVRRRIPIVFSARRSNASRFWTIISNSPGKPANDHFDRQESNNDREYDAQHARLGASEKTAPDERPDENTEHDGHGKARIDVAAVQINAGAGSRSDADHEIAGRCGNLERQAHGAVHRQDLHGAGADPQPSGEDSGNEHYGETCRNAAHVVGPQPVRSGIRSVHPESSCQLVRLARIARLRRRTKGGIGRGWEDEAEDDGDGVNWEI